MIQQTFVRATLATLTAAVCAFAGLAATPPAFAQDAYPNKPVKVIINSSPGGLTDVIGRLVTLDRKSVV